MNSERTAITRKISSRPCRDFLAALPPRPGAKILDYGCGQGRDVQVLNDKGFHAVGYDPYQQRYDDPRVLQGGPFDVVFCTYVLNVIEDSKERVDLLAYMASLVTRGGHLSVSARTPREVNRAAEEGGWKPGVGGGWITSKQTYQVGISRSVLWNAADFMGNATLHPVHLGGTKYTNVVFQL